MKLAQKGLQHFLYLSKNQQEMCEFFLWVIFHAPLAAAALHSNMFSHIAQGLSEWHDMHFKQQAVTEFFVAEKKTVTNIHKQLKKSLHCQCC
jgi:hypothetical protein